MLATGSHNTGDGLHGGVCAVIILVGNKTDLGEHRTVTIEEGQEYASSNGMLFIETSAKTAANVPAIFESVATKLTSPAAAVPAPTCRGCERMTGASGCLPKRACTCG